MKTARADQGGPASTQELLWGVRQRPSRGPKPGLSVEKIVHAAITAADAEGLDAVSMQRVAADLGYTTMSLYRYVASKEQLVELMRDTATGDPPAMDPASGWRSKIELWTREIWAQYQRHPWILRVPISGPPTGPHALAWFEAALSGLCAAGLDGVEAMAASLFLDGAARDIARLAADVAGARQQAGLTPDQAEQDYGRILAKYLDSEKYPTLSGLVSSGVFDAAGPDDDLRIELEFGVARVLDGIQAFVDARSSGSGT